MIFDIKCKSCKRYLGNTNKSMQATIKCSNSKCKQDNYYKIIFVSDMIKKGSLT